MFVEQNIKILLAANAVVIAALWTYREVVFQLIGGAGIFTGRTFRPESIWRLLFSAVDVLIPFFLRLNQLLEDVSCSGMEPESCALKSSSLLSAIRCVCCFRLQI